jgi:23S rRNA (adenine2503-C2)-methyltransferase
MNQIELQALCLEAGQTRFRGDQIFEWMYRHGISSFDLMLNVNKSFREHLEEHYILQTLQVGKSMPSKLDNSIKILFKTRENHFIETVSMVDGGRHTVCISSQVGCALDCSFCATGSLGLKRNLSTGEIVDQLIYIRENIDHPITNVVFMGMGEPFHNYGNVLNAADIFHSPKGFNLASTRITISTAGLLPQIKQFIDEKRRYKLAISLNASHDGVRNKIMPINKKWNINNLIQTGRKYSNQKKRLIMFEYVLLKGINDSEKDALELARLLHGISCKVNLIPYNKTDGKYQRPDKDVITRFSEILHENRDGYRVLVRWSKGQDIDAGCGQLAGQEV